MRIKQVNDEKTLSDVSAHATATAARNADLVGAAGWGRRARNNLKLPGTNLPLDCSKHHVWHMPEATIPETTITFETQRKLGRVRPPEAETSRRSCMCLQPLMIRFAYFHANANFVLPKISALQRASYIATPTRPQRSRWLQQHHRRLRMSISQSSPGCCDTNGPT